MKIFLVLDGVQFLFYQGTNLRVLVSAGSLPLKGTERHLPQSLDRVASRRLFYEWPFYVEASSFCTHSNRSLICNISQKKHVSLLKGLWRWAGFLWEMTKWEETQRWFHWIANWETMLESVPIDYRVFLSLLVCVSLCN